MPPHELGLIVDGRYIDVLVFFEFGIDVKGEWPHPCCLFLLPVGGDVDTVVGITMLGE